MEPVKTSYDHIPAYTTKDGSTVRELMHPAVHGGKNQSLAEAIVPVGAATRKHLHFRTEEIYHITGGQGKMTLGGRRFDVCAGDTILIPPKTPHGLRNTGTGQLKLLCCCSPAYAHGDTALVR